MVHSRRKGHTRERKIRHRFIAAGWPDAKRGDQSRAGHEESDVCVGDRRVLISGREDDAWVWIPGFRIEVKDNKSLPGKRVLAAYDQAKRTCSPEQIPVAVFHVGRGGDYAFLDLAHLLQLASCGTADGRGGDSEQCVSDTGEHGANGAPVPEEDAI